MKDYAFQTKDFDRDLPVKGFLKLLLVIWYKYDKIFQIYFCAFSQGKYTLFICIICKGILEMISKLSIFPVLIQKRPEDRFNKLHPISTFHTKEKEKDEKTKASNTEVYFCMQHFARSYKNQRPSNKQNS